MNPKPEQAREALVELVDRYYQDYDDEKRNAQSEANVRANFIDPLFDKILGWPIDDGDYYDREQYVRGAGRADIALTVDPDMGPVLFVEAKRFGAIDPLDRVQLQRDRAVDQLRLPGMSVDRTREEQQAINYAYEKGIRWAVLTNFEHLRLFDAFRDTLVLSFETPRELQERFEELWYLSYEEVARGRLDELRAHRERADVDAEYLNLINIWRQRLGEDIYSHPNNRALLADPATGKVDVYKLRDVVQRILDRLVVIRYAEDRLVINPDQLRSLVETSQQVGYISLLPLVRDFFSGFNVQHDGTLFAPHLCDELEIGEDVLGAIIHNLYDARFRAMSPDIMGNTYEQYLGQTLTVKDGHVQTVDNLETRKEQGSYYTPEYIVHYIVDHTLGRLLYATEDGQPNGPPLDGVSPKTLEDIDGSQGRPLKVLDPASGSGSFLIYAYQVLEGFYQREIERLKSDRDARAEELLAQGEMPMDIRIALADLDRRLKGLRDYQNQILERHIYGVDLDPQAAELAAVNLMLQALKRNWRLPLILNQNIKVGNSLIGGAPVQPPRGDDPGPLDPYAAQFAELRRLRIEQQDATDDDEQVEDLQEQIDALRTEINAELNAPLADYFGDVGNRRPFNWVVEFPEVFLDEDGHWQDQPGFDVVFGNPPWGRTTLGDIEKDYFASLPNTDTRHPDTYTLFIRLALTLSRSNTVGGYIVPDTLLLKEYPVTRDLLLDNTRLLQVIHAGQPFPEVNIDSVVFTYEMESNRELRDNTDIGVGVSSEFAANMYTMRQSIFRDLEDHRFNIYLSPERLVLRDYLSNQFPRWDSLCETHEGIHTGNVRNKLFVDERLDANTFPLIFGRDEIDRYLLAWGGKYVRYDKDLINREEGEYASLREERIFDAPKIIVRRTGDRILAAYDNEGFYTSNNMFCMQVKPDAPNYDLRYILGLLNSALMTAAFRLEVPRVGRLFAELKITHLDAFPIRLIDFSLANEKRDYDSLIKLVQMMLDLNEALQTTVDEFADCLAAWEYENRSFRQAYANHGHYRGHHLIRVGPVDANARGTVVAVRVAMVREILEVYITLEESEEEEHLIGWRIENDDLRRFLLLSLRAFLSENARKRIWSRGHILRGVLSALEVPVFDDALADRNLAIISELMTDVQQRTTATLIDTLGERMDDLPDPLAIGEIENLLEATDHRIDELVYELYGITDPEDIVLIEEIVA